MNYTQGFLVALANGEQSLEKLEECRPARGGVGLIRGGRSSTRSRRRQGVVLLVMMWSVLHILDKGLLEDRFNQGHDVWSISTRVIVGNSNVPNLFEDEIKDIELGLLDDSLEKIPLKLRHPIRITLSRCQCLPNDLEKNNELRLEVGNVGAWKFEVSYIEAISLSPSTFPS
jgi:hypothetical protein